jgi:2-methylcitrate dehydratase PrpD
MTQTDRVTQTLAHYLVNARSDDLPQAVRDHAVRTFVNWMGCAVGASQHEAVEIAIAALAPLAARPRSMCWAPRSLMASVRTSSISTIHT